MTLRRRRRAELSIVVVAYDMERELPRTLRSLSTAYQRDVAGLPYEVIVVDNGSPRPVDPGIARDLPGEFTVVRIDDASPSPAAAVNAGVARSRGRLVGVVLDGARMVTPGTVRRAVTGARLGDRPVIATLAWHLGPDHQLRSVPAGYDQREEDRLLASIGWPDDGYRLFEIAALAGSNAGGWFGPVAESCCLFVTRDLFDELGGYDERFDLPGGGLVNLDFFVRACAAPGAELVVLLGEGSFHQLHGGTATNAIGVDRWPEFHAQYERLTGRHFAAPANERIYLGDLPPAARRFVCPG